MVSADRRLAVTQRLPGNADAPRMARDAAAQLIVRLGARAHKRADDIALAVSELASNAVVHGPAGEFELRLTGTPELIRVEVADLGTVAFSWPPVSHKGHHGLDLVGIFSDRSGSVHDPTTVAWCEFDLA